MYRWHFGVHGRSKMGDKWSKKEKGGEGAADALRIDSVLILSIYGLFKQRSRLNFSDEDSVWSLSLLNSIFTFLFGRFLTFHQSCSSLHSFFKAQKHLKNKGKSEFHKSSDDFRMTCKVKN